MAYQPPQSPPAAAGAPRRGIPSLDGLRAISIALVLLGHTALWTGIRGGPTFFFAWAQLGVSTFFVISGFLITRLLVAESNSGGIRLLRFYRRRALRIFPAFYVYIAAIALLSAAGWVPENRANFLTAATYTWNYASHVGGWYLGHIWSLCVEEQFYLLWALALYLCGRRRGFWLAAAVVALSPFSRVGTYLFVPPMRARIDIMLHTRIDTILCGCLLAMGWDWTWLRQAIRRHARPWAVCAAVAFLLVATPLAANRWDGKYMYPLGYTLQSLCITFLVAAAVLRPESRSGRILNSRPLRHIGLISYSLYLWQELCLGPQWHAVPWALFAALGAAEASYYLVERPVLRWRDRRDAPPPAQAASASA